MWSTSGITATKRSKRTSHDTSSSSPTQSSSPSSWSYGIDETGAMKLFTEFADDDNVIDNNGDPSIVGSEGIVRLCERVGLDPLEDVRALVLLWRLGSRDRPGQISKDEFLDGCQRLQIDTVEKVRALTPTLDLGFLEEVEFKDFYKFCFQFNRQGSHRTLDKDMVVSLLMMVLKDRIGQERLDTFCTFLESQTTNTHITLDQWTSFLDFSSECKDLSTYDEGTSAWPVLIDEYVEYMEDQQQKQT